jgi:hypothetical protein
MTNHATAAFVMATGWDAADVAITTSFGDAYLSHFYVDSFELDEHDNKVPILSFPADTAL